MKRTLASIIILIITAILFSGCNDDAKQSSDSEDRAVEQKENSEENRSTNKTGDDSGNTSEEADSTEKPSKEEGSKDDNALAGYPADEIEFARVWLQIIGNQDIEELNVYHTSAGELVNPYDETSVDYPEDVISLGGGIMADGIVTYSGNGDGTINLYDVPSHWPSEEQIDISMEEYTENIIKNTEQIYIETGNDEEVIALIEKLNIEN
ncbi:hypothetical protein [Oceanobacillus neutriphilus]|uniref:Lipoprotein YdeJ n=1 Tax=Oceanobacillus neutriphilus TaxID=531815 RepID=A0ABQ2NX03_9BACI|nr:hypothetical protein [Oceanobacillus neutriphilus]GGP12594.1 putative lipoprotein YdeJ [Oceanobacillus neutriphilus]